MKNLDEFYEEVLKSKDLQTQFKSCKKEEDVVLFLKKNNCDAKLDDVKKFLQKKFTNEGKINSEEVEKISGGAQGCTMKSLNITFSIISAGTVCLVETLASTFNKVGGELKENDSAFCHD